MHSFFVNTIAFQFAPLFLDISICALWVAVLGNLFIKNEEHGHSHTSNDICYLEHEFIFLLLLMISQIKFSGLYRYTVQSETMNPYVCGSASGTALRTISKSSSSLVAYTAIQHWRIVLKSETVQWARYKLKSFTVNWKALRIHLVLSQIIEGRLYGEPRYQYSRLFSVR
jgi:hypothetical protein